MPRAAVDVGSNSLLLTVVDDDGRILHDEARVVGLGRGLGDRGLFQPDRMKAAAGSGYSTATDLADWLVREAGLPFRDAHHVTGRAVALAEQKGCELSALSLDELQAINPAITDKVYDVLTVEASVASRTSFGGTAPDNVRQQIAWWRGRN